MEKKTILVDFDGTLNSYRSGFDAGRPHYLPDAPNPGAIGWLRRLMVTQYKPVIFTTRALLRQTGQVNVEVVEAIRDWLYTHGLEKPAADAIEVTCIKIPCSLIVDDNAWRFEGKWPTPEELVKLTRKQ
jgi:hypothetical protein